MNLLLTDSERCLLIDALQERARNLERAAKHCSGDHYPPIYRNEAARCLLLCRRVQQLHVARPTDAIEVPLERVWSAEEILNREG